jgi:D-alanyl-lipoteichoic acid acyltransferase DltB (MBOAT superfamily)
VLEAWQWSTFFEVILPLGISFYTFQAMSYTIDVYRGEARAMGNLVDFSCFVSMFPHLVAGPILKFSFLAGQLEQRTHTMEKFARGAAFFILGLSKKILLANPCGKVADLAFLCGTPSTLDAWFGAVAYAFQIYFDFSAYSDMAIGLGLMLGFVFAKNFDSPYRAVSITDFWRRWHISLSCWLRDYLYIPLGGSKGGTWMRIRNTFIIFLVSGFWHGANWTFIAWGFLNALFIMPSILFSTNRINLNIVAQGRHLPGLKEFLSIVLTFSLTVFAWIFFRAKSMEHAFQYIGSICKDPVSIFSINTYSPFGYLLTLILVFLGIEWAGRENQYAIARIGFSWPRLLRWNFYLLIGLVIFFYGNFNKTEFIYFAF